MKKDGFTLIELMICIAIMGIVASMLVGFINGKVDTKVNYTTQNMRTLVGTLFPMASVGGVLCQIENSVNECTATVEFDNGRKIITADCYRTKNGCSLKAIQGY